MDVRELDIVKLKAIKEILEQRIEKNQNNVENIFDEHRNFDYACDDDWRGDEIRESRRLITFYTKKLEIVEEQIENVITFIHS